jgi:hypothetical protein
VGLLVFAVITARAQFYEIKNAKVETETPRKENTNPISLSIMLAYPCNPDFTPLQSEPNQSNVSAPIPNEVRTLQDNFDASVTTSQIPQELILLIAKYVGPIFRPKKSAQELLKEITYLGSTIILLANGVQDDNLGPLALLAGGDYGDDLGDVGTLDRKKTITGIDFADCPITYIGMQHLVNSFDFTEGFGFGFSEKCLKIFKEQVSIPFNKTKIIQSYTKKIYKIATDCSPWIESDCTSMDDGQKKQAKFKGSLSGPCFIVNDDLKTYNGMMVTGKYSGHGIFTYSNIFEYSNKAHYAGEWHKSRKHGHGVYTTAEGSTYEGIWSENNLNKGICHFHNGDKYEGELQAEGLLPHGQGICHYWNGDRYEGQWNMGQRHGHGIYTNADARSCEGEWLENKLQGPIIYHEANGIEHKAECHTDDKNIAKIDVQAKRNSICAAVWNTLLHRTWFG